MIYIYEVFKSLKIKFKNQKYKNFLQNRKMLVKTYLLSWKQFCIRSNEKEIK